MSIQSQLKRIVLTAGLAGALLFGGYKGVEHSSRSATREYVTQNVERFVQKQENKFGIDHQRTPSIEFGLYDDSNFGGTTYGLFDAETGNITINDRATVTPNSPVRNWIYGLFNKTESIDYVLHHELGHAYVEEQLPDVGLESFPDTALNDSRMRGKLTGQKMISEGIADYFAFGMLDMPRPNPDDVWADEPQDPIYFPKRSHFYDGGNALVAPILDKFGVDTGIEKLLRQTPPLSFNKGSLRAYQQEMLNESTR